MTDEYAAQWLPNTLALESRAKRVFYVQSPTELAEAASWAAAEGLPLIPLGAGSNVVLPPQLNAAVVFVADESVTTIENSPWNTVLRVGAGKHWHTLVTETLAGQHYGLENLALIPGCVGAAPVQNIGAYGRELSEFVEAVHGVNLDSLTLQTLSCEDCEFSYRDSVFKHALKDRFVITAVDLRLSKQPEVQAEYPSLVSQLEGRADPLTPEMVCAEVVAVRRARLPDPAVEPNVGSFFKNPVVNENRYKALQQRFPQMPGHRIGDAGCKLSAAWLIEHSGLRGYRLGAAGVSERHSLVLVNHGGASQTELLSLAAHIQERVMSGFEIALSIEPRVFSGE